MSAGRLRHAEELSPAGRQEFPAFAPDARIGSHQSRFGEVAAGIDE